jgi:hypothetical protein
MNPTAVDTLPVNSTLRGQPVPGYLAVRSGWLAKLEPVLFVSICGYFAVSLLNAAKLV